MNRLVGPAAEIVTGTIAVGTGSLMLLYHAAERLLTDPADADHHNGPEIIEALAIAGSGAVLAVNGLQAVVSRLRQ